MWAKVLLTSLPLALADYCTAGNTVLGDSNLGSVHITGVQGSSIADEKNCPGTTGIIDNKGMKVIVQPGGTYSLQFQATTCDAGWARLGYAFIDFNGNQQFEQSELIGSYNVDNRPTPVDITFPVVPPCIGEGSVVGTTVMRIFVVESGATPNPCLQFSYGGVKEFSVQIIDVPGAQCGGSDMSTGGGMSGGSKFLLSLFIILFIYFAGSAIWVLKVKPEHRDKVWFAPLTKGFWLGLMDNVKYGCLLSKSKVTQLVDRARGRQVADSYTEATI